MGHNRAPRNLGHIAIHLALLLCQVVLVLCDEVKVGSEDSFYPFEDLPTEPPELVEVFDPQNWVSQAVTTQQIEIVGLKLMTQVKLRYARTRINIHLQNKHDRELQADFKIALPDNAFFTVFQVKRGNKPRIYSAQIVKRDLARRLYHAARTGTNGTVSAAYIELSQQVEKTGIGEVSFYNLKVSLPAQENLHVFLVYERQLERVSRAYSDRIQVYPSNPVVRMSSIGYVQFSVNVEEIEEIEELRCSPEMEAVFSKCTSKAMRRLKDGRRHKYQELNWRQSKVGIALLEEHSFQFHYELKHQNETSTAVVIAQNNGNLYFAHLLMPENLPAIPKHIVFLLDISDSMHGKKLDQLQWSMLEIVKDLGPQDYFNIIGFANDIISLNATSADSSENWGDLIKCPFPLPATKHNKLVAETFILDKLIAHGATNIYLALEEAFRVVQSISPETSAACANETTPRQLPHNVQSMIFFLSDGKATIGPTNNTFLLKTVYNWNNQNQSRPVPVHTIAYGDDADVNFLRDLSTSNHGMFKIIREESAAGIELQNFYKEISFQVLSQVKTTVTSANNSALTYAFSPVTVIRGGEVVTTGKLVHPPQTNETFSSSALTWSTEAMGSSGKLVYYNSPVYDCTNLEVQTAKCVDRINFYLERLQAYQLLKKLLERDKLVEDGYICPQSYHDQFQDLRLNYANNEESKMDCQNIYKIRATEMALKHNFVTKYTSFISTTTEVDAGLRPDKTLPPESESDSVERGSYVPSSTRSEKIILLRSLAQTELNEERRIESIPLEKSTEPIYEQLPSANRLVGLNTLDHLKVASSNLTSNSSNSSTTEKNSNHPIRKIIIVLKNLTVTGITTLFPTTHKKH